MPSEDQGNPLELPFRKHTKKHRVHNRYRVPIVGVGPYRSSNSGGRSSRSSSSPFSGSSSGSRSRNRMESPLLKYTLSWASGRETDTWRFLNLYCAQLQCTQLVLSSSTWAYHNQPFNTQVLRNYNTHLSFQSNSITLFKYRAVWIPIGE